jgi:serine/threonine protein kinase
MRKQSVRCAGCHAEAPDDATFCGSCGRAFRIVTARTHGAVLEGDTTRASPAPSTAPEGPLAAGDDSASELHPGDVVVGGYVVDHQVGRGGMGTVYLATDAVSGQRVAVKVLPASLARERDIRERFVREARALAALDHSGIVPLITFAQEGDARFLVMKYVAGESLESLVRREGVLEPTRATQIVREMADALDYAHAHGVIHRDIKPSNILIAADGHVVIVDFGIARTDDSGQRVTETGMLMGTPQYMSPEQIVGSPVDGRADLYACGLVLFEMLAGAPPFDGDKTFEILRSHVDDLPPDVALIRARTAPNAAPVPPSLQVVLAHLLEKDPAKRPERGRILRQWLDGSLPLPAMATSPSVDSSPKRRRTTSETPAIAFPDAGAPKGSPKTKNNHTDDDEDLDDDQQRLVSTSRPLAWVAAIVGLIAVTGGVVLSVDEPTSASSLDGGSVVDAGDAGDGRFEAAVLVSRARVALDRGRLDDARIALETARQLKLDGDVVRLTQAELLAASGDAKGARAMLASVAVSALDAVAGERHAALLARLETPVPSSPTRTKPSSTREPGKPASVPPTEDSDRRPRPSMLDDDSLAATTSSTRERVSACFTTHVIDRLDDDADAPAGDVTLELSIAPDGRVSAVNVAKATVGDEAFHRCIKDAVLTWRFPPFGGGGDTLVHAFSFRTRR